MRILDGVKVLDISCVVAAPMSATLLAEFGADVIRAEIPHEYGEDSNSNSSNSSNSNAGVGGGDSSVSTKSLYRKVLNRNKKCITLDFHYEEARDIFYRLVKWADVVVANFRPETLKKFGIDYEDVVRYNPQIIYMAFSAFGRTGVNSDRPGYARAAEAYAGLAYITGEKNGGPLFSGTWITDGIGGIYAAFLMALALFHKERTGEGQLIDLGLYEPLFRIMDNIPLNYDVFGQIRERNGNMHATSAPNNMYVTADNIRIALPVNSQKMYERFCNAVSKPELISNPQYASPKDRFANRAELDSVVSDIIRRYDYEELAERLDEAHVAYSKVNSIKDIFEDRHIWERESLVRVHDDELNRDIAVNGVCGKFSKTPGSLRWTGRRRGQDNDEIYKKMLGMTEEYLDELKTKGVI